MVRSTVVIGDSRNMVEIKDNSIQLIVTSPPYFNVKDYGIENVGSINEYKAYLLAMRQIFGECYRVIENGRYICVNVSDIISGGKRYPIPCDFIGILHKSGFEYREDILWKKPDGLGSSKRFGTFIKHPYPMYYYPNNIFEHILVFRKGKFDFKTVSKETKTASKVDLAYAKSHWSTDIWEMVPEIKNQHNKDTHPAMFPIALPEALIRLYTYEGETCLDPFLGSGTSLQAARKLRRNAIGYEINLAYLELIESKIGFLEGNPDFEIIKRGDSDG